MKKSFLLNLFFMILLCSFAKVTRAQDESTGGTFSAQERPFGISLELGGRSIIYSYSLDYQLNEDLRAGAGIGTLSNFDFIFFEWHKLKIIPLYADWSFYRSPGGRGSAYLSFGLTYFQGEISGGSFFEELFDSATEDTPMPFHGYVVPLGLGWEYRGNGGFLFRIATYLAYLRVSADEGDSESAFTPAFGMHFGYAF